MNWKTPPSHPRVNPLCHKNFKKKHLNTTPSSWSKKTERTWKRSARFPS